MKLYSKKGYKQLLVKEWFHTEINRKEFIDEMIKIEPEFMDFEILYSITSPKTVNGILLIYNGKTEMIML